MRKKSRIRTKQRWFPAHQYKNSTRTKHARNAVVGICMILHCNFTRKKRTTKGDDETAEMLLRSSGSAS